MKKFILVLSLFVAPMASALEITGGDYQGREDVISFVQRVAENSA